MGMVTQSLARQSAILRSANAQAAIIGANQGIQDLARNGGDISAVAAKERSLLMQKEQAELQKKAADAEKKALSSKKNKLDIYG